MSQEPYTIGAFAKLTGVTERTLRYYDRKGLLHPSSRNGFGHRYYTNGDLIRLQHILTLKYLDYSLDEIDRFLNEPGHDLRQSLTIQHELLQNKKAQLDRILETMGRMRSIVDGFRDIESSHILMLIHTLEHEEAQKSWLTERLPSEYVKALFMENASPEERLAAERKMMQLHVELHDCAKRGCDPHDPQVQQLADELLAVIQHAVNVQISDLRGRFEELELAGQLDFDPALFPGLGSEAEEQFLSDVFEYALLRSEQGEQGEQGGDGDDGTKA